MRIYSLLLILIILRISIKIVNKISASLDDNFRSSFLMVGFLGRNYLSSELLPSQFEDWCKNFLIGLGYKNIILKSEAIEGGINLICRDEGGLIYICTSLLSKKNSGPDPDVLYGQDDYQEFSIIEAQQFIGAMAHDGVTKGIIITTGDFHCETIKYLKSLSSKYEIRLIDGLIITKELRKIRKKEVLNRISDINRIY